MNGEPTYCPQPSAADELASVLHRALSFLDLHPGTPRWPQHVTPTAHRGGCRCSTCQPPQARP